MALPRFTPAPRLLYGLSSTGSLQHGSNPGSSRRHAATAKATAASSVSRSGLVLKDENVVANLKNYQYCGPIVLV